MSERYEALSDDDLTPEQLDGMAMWDRDVMLDERHRATGAFLVRRAVAEIRRHRSAQTASEERVRSAVLSGIEEYARYAEGAPLGGHGTVACDIATRAAKQLAGAGLSEEDLLALCYLSGWCNANISEVIVDRERFERGVAALDRLLARSTP